jgi:hypothetical protein
MTRHVERGEQRAVAGIVVRPRRRLPLGHRQRRLGALERLDLALLVDREHHGVLRRVQVQADDVAHLGDEGGVARHLEALDPVRLQAVLAPDLLDRGLAQAGRPGQGARAPVRGIGRRLAQGLLLPDLLRRHRRRSPGAGPVAQHHAVSEEALLPAPDDPLGLADA